MSKPVKHFVQFMALMAALTLIPAALAPSTSTDTPYVSALADLTVSPVLAAKCVNKTCDFSNPDRARCVQSHGNKCAAQGQRCVSGPC